MRELLFQRSLLAKWLAKHLSPHYYNAMSTKSKKPNILSVAGPNSKYNRKGVPPAGFWAGVWHGIIAPLVFLIGLFTDDVKIYETRNNGRWYDFGFLIGVGFHGNRMVDY